MLPPLKEHLNQHGIRADKRFGQHFLLDGNLTDKIVRMAGKLDGVNVVEVGPGPGGLTRSLLKSQAAHLWAIEKDARLLPLLNELVEKATTPALTIIEADALQFSIPQEIPAPRAILSNLPYNVGTPLLIKWLHEIAADAGAYLCLTLMFQKEVAQRIAAAPGSNHYGRLSVISQWLCEVQPLFDLPPQAFTPPPKVDSSVIRLLPRPQPLKADIFALEKVTAAAFGQRRKMLRAALKSLKPGVESWLESCDIAPTERAERLTVEQFIRLSNSL